MKIIQYCQHVLGVGHLFRSLEICKALSDHEVILVTGGPPFKTDMPKHVSEFRLPDLQMDTAFKGLFSTEKSTTLDQIKEQRQKRLFALFEREKPDVFVVELYPFGRKAFRFELDPVLQAIKEKRLHCRGVFSSVRDILVEKEQQAKHEARAVGTLNNFFDAVLIHSDAKLVKLEETFYRFSEIKIPVVYTGYIAPPKPAGDCGARLRKHLGIGENEILITASAGGGSVGTPLLESVVRAFDLLNLQRSCYLHVFTGPFIEKRNFNHLKRLASSRVVIDAFTTDFLAYLAAADLSISMAGYNTSMNILAARPRALVWPFPQNREQRLRAERLAGISALEVLDDRDLVPNRLAAIMGRALSRSDYKSKPVDLDGAAKTAKWLNDWAKGDAVA